MASSTINIQLDTYRTDKQRELLKMLNDKAVQKQVNTYIKDAINPFVPMKSGALRRSARVTHKSITWGQGLKYAHYQYMGEVYGPNFPIIKGGLIVGWYSKKGMKKYPTGRELGVSGEWLGWRFGYTTQGTQHHWDKAFTYQVKQKTNLDITRFLKRECKRRGLS